MKLFLKSCRVLLLIWTFGGLTACEKQLDLVPIGNLTETTYYKTADDARAAVGACYAPLPGIVDGIDFLDLVTTDDGVPFLTGIADRPLLWRYNIAPNNGFANLWTASYSAINRTNTVIDRLPGIVMDETLKKRYIAEAKFLRAFHYFNLVRLYGDVPLVTKETTSLENLQVERAKVEDVYALIEADLKEAETVLPAKYTGADVGRAAKGSAKGFLAKLYLTRAGTTKGSPYWAQAAAKAKEVIDLGVYDLWANYGDAFAIANRGGKEFVFELQFLTDVRGHGFGRGYGVRGVAGYPGGTGSGIARVTPSLFNLFAPTDTRRAVNFITSYLNGATNVTLSLLDPDPAKGIYFQKLWDRTAKTNGGEGTSFPIMRYSDILLMYAEALNEANSAPTPDALAALNRVHTRAGLSALTNLNYTQFRDAVWTERRVEFVFENQRRFDLIRTGRLIDAVKAETSFARNPTIQPFHLLMPIPQSEIDANPKLVQNQGY